MEEKLTILIDHREANTRVAKLLESNFNIKHQYTNLTIGDYVINNSIIVERKTLNDLVKSIIDGRLFMQASQLNKKSCWKAIILEGNNIRYDMSRASIQGALITTSMQFEIPLLRSKNAEETVQLMQYMAAQLNHQNHPVKTRFGAKPKKIYNQQLHLLQGLPHVGPDKSMKLLNHFNSLYEIANADIKSLEQCPGIGKDTARKIFTILRNIS